jgi:ABC-2 type transport system permease protein
MSKMLYALLKKDFTEILRNSQMLVFLFFCAFFGILSPLTAHYLPKILAMVGETQNMIIQLPDVTYRDGMLQYVKNFTQIGTIIIIFLCMGGIAKEKDQGTMSFLLAKPVARPMILLSKLIIQGLLMVLGLTLAMLLALVYTLILFGSFPIGRFILGNVVLLWYFITIMGITVGISALCEKPMVAGVGSVTIWMLGALVGSIPRIGLFSFTKLSNQFNLVMEGFSVQWQPFFGSTLLLCIISIIGMVRLQHWEPND